MKAQSTSLNELSSADEKRIRLLLYNFPIQRLQIKKSSFFLEIWNTTDWWKIEFSFIENNLESSKAKRNKIVDNFSYNSVEPKYHFLALLLSFLFVYRINSDPETSFIAWSNLDNLKKLLLFSFRYFHAPTISMMKNQKFYFFFHFNILLTRHLK